jgi:ABC-type transport system substrate-binding protein
LWFLSALFRSDGGNNHSNLKSATIDALLDALSKAKDHQVRVAMTADAHSEILNEVPVSNLITPFWHVGLSERVKDYYEPWGSDYYVIRADLIVAAGAVGEAPAPAAAPASTGNRMFDHGITMLVSASLVMSSLISLMA